LTIANRDVDLIQAEPLPVPRPLDQLIDEALAAPIGATWPPTDLPPSPRVTIIVSDPTRNEPREAFITALRRRLPPDTRLTIAIATGTHGPCDLAALRLAPATIAGATIVNHDGHHPSFDRSTGGHPDDSEASGHDHSRRNLAAPDSIFVELGTTRRGTPMRVHRCVIEADLVIATGCIRPHYFAGFGAGCKAIFPGLGEATAIRINHRLKTEPGARAGIVDDNPCREDLEEAVALLPTPTFLLDAVVGPDQLVHHVVAGDIRSAFRAGADRARPWFTVRARPAKLVIASDALPITASLYQAAKIAAAVAPLVEPGGTLALVAECANGVEPLHTVNEAIFRIGVLPRLPSATSLRLVSSLPPSVVRTTLLEPTPSLEDVLDAHPGERAVIVPRASQLLCEPAL
jgi:nickel-dependent lactate racemase